MAGSAVVEGSRVSGQWRPEPHTLGTVSRRRERRQESAGDSRRPSGARRPRSHSLLDTQTAKEDPPAIASGTRSQHSPPEPAHQLSRASLRLGSALGGKWSSKPLKLVGDAGGTDRAAGVCSLGIHRPMPVIFSPRFPGARGTGCTSFLKVPGAEAARTSERRPESGFRKESKSSFRRAWKEPGWRAPAQCSWQRLHWLQWRFLTFPFHGSSLVPSS